MGHRLMYSYLERLKLFVMISFLLYIATFSILQVKGEEQPRLLRMLEMEVLSNSTVIVSLSSTPEIHGWQFFKNSFYNLNKSYWNSYVVNKVVEMFDLLNYRVLKAEEDDARYAFIIKVAFQLKDSKRYVKQNDTLSILDAFKPDGEYLSSIRVESERNIYDCTPRDKVWPQRWYFTQRIEWRNIAFSDAPEEYEIYFKIPLRILSNLPSDIMWRIYIDSKLVEARGNVFPIYVDDSDIVSVEEIIEDQDGVRYVCNSSSLRASLEVNRTLSFYYVTEYKVSLDSVLKAKAITINGYEYTLPYEFWVAENYSLNISMIPMMVEGSFINHVFDGWVDSNGTRLGRSFTVSRPMRLTAIWRRELNLTNIAFIVFALVFALLIPELKKRVSIEIIWDKPSKNPEEKNRQLYMSDMDILSIVEELL